MANAAEEQRMAALGILPIEDTPKETKEIPHIPDPEDGIFETVAKSVVGGFLDIGSGIVGSAAGVAKLVGAGEDNFLEEMREKIKSSGKNFEVTPHNSVEWAARLIGRTLPQIGSMVVGGAYAGKLGIMALGLLTGGQEAYDGAKARGASEVNANIERFLIGGIEGAISLLQVPKILRLGEEGKMTLKQFKDLVRTKAYDQIAQAGGKLGVDTLKLSIFQAATTAVNSGVQLAVPAILEGKQALPLDENGDFDWDKILTQVGEAAFASAVTSPFISATQGVLTGLSTPSVSRIELLKKAILTNPHDTMAHKAGLLSHIQSFEGKFNPKITVKELQDMGLIKTKQNPDGTFGVKDVAQVNKYIDLIGKFDNSIETWSTATGKTEFSLPKEDFSKSVSKYTDFSKIDVQTIKDMILEVHGNSIKKQGEVMKIFTDMFVRGNLPDMARIKELQPILGTRVTRDMAKQIQVLEGRGLSFASKTWRRFVDTVNLPKAMLASSDFSGSLRQGFFMPFTDFKAWKKGVTSGWRSFFSPEYADFMEVLTQTHPYFDLAQKSGLAKSELGIMTQTEEYFANNMSGKLGGIRAGERAYVTALNTMRYYSFYNIAEKWAGTGKTFKDYTTLANILNHLTGKGDIAKLKDWEPFLNVAFFAPGLVQSRFQLGADVFTTTSASRKVLASTLVGAVGTGAMILALASQIPGVKVEADPRSTDFGKIRFGNTRIDFWAGYSQIARLITGLVTGQVKTTGAGKIIDKDRGETITRFLQTKLSPVAGLAVDLTTGQTFKGDAMGFDATTVSSQLYERTAPLFLQDVIDAIRFQGLGADTLLTAGLTLHGVGTMTYPESESTKLEKMKNKYSKETYGTDWDELSGPYQEMLNMQFPLIGQQQEKVRQENLYKPARVRYIQDIRNSEIELTKSLPKTIQRQLNSLLVDVGGLSRKIGSGWYLNDERYKEYKQKVSEGLNETLPSILSLDIEPELKSQFIEHMIEQIKDGVRSEITMDATMKDLMRG